MQKYSKEKLGWEWYDYIIFLVNILIILAGLILLITRVVFAEGINLYLALGILFLFTAYVSSEFLYKKTKNKNAFIFCIIIIFAILIVGILQFLNLLTKTTL